MLMLAERLYVAWRERMEFIDPQPYGVTRGDDYRFGRSPAYKLRPAWNRLPANEQAVWKHVADAAGTAHHHQDYCAPGCPYWGTEWTPERT